MEQTIEFAFQPAADRGHVLDCDALPRHTLVGRARAPQSSDSVQRRLTKTYYYNSYTAEIAPFMNVSDVPDERLSGLAIEMRAAVFDESKRRRMYERSFGKTLGPALWEVSRLKPLRQLGNALVSTQAC